MIFILYHIIKGYDSRCQKEELQCKNGGYCMFKNGIPKCTCIEGFHGETCQFDTKQNQSLIGTIIENKMLPWFSIVMTPTIN